MLHMKQRIKGPQGLVAEDASPELTWPRRPTGKPVPALRSSCDRRGWERILVSFLNSVTQETTLL